MNISVCNIVFVVLLSLSMTGCIATPLQNQSSIIGYKQTGKASFYADKFQSRKTANGERFDQASNTAAHKKLPFGTKVKVTNINNGKSVVVRINDRGPFIKGRIIDLSRSAFSSIGNTNAGIIKVKIEVVE